MDPGPVSGRTDAQQSWRLAAPHDAMTQGLVVSGFASLPTGRALFLELTEQATGSGWLRALDGIAPITDADGRDPAAAAIAFSYAGLSRMGVPQAALDSFAAPFREGMMQEDRSRRLGDRRNGKWLETVIEGGPQWSANTAQRGAMPGDAAPAALTATGHIEEQVTTPLTVHALLLLYDATEEEAERRQAEVAAAVAPLGVRIVRTLPLELRPDANGIAREHFGFADGVSQPLPYDEAGSVLVGGAPARPDPWNGVALGDFLLGHLNGHHEVAPGPMAPADPPALAADLPPHPSAEGFLDLGLDGSYMVVRELRQNVGAFWRSMREGAARIAASGSAPGTTDAEWLAERVVGRSTGGDLLCPGGYLKQDGGRPANDVGFFDRDRTGLGCPAGSHVRRANPRDGLAPSADLKQTLLDAANHHRLLRRGRKYGPACDDPVNADDRERGLLFMCLNTDIGRQFEFVQQTWLLNSNFATLYDETDPLVGPKGTMTIREQPLRRIVPVETFVQLVGGDYFFLPSMAALRYLTAL